MLTQHALSIAALTLQLLIATGCASRLSADVPQHPLATDSGSTIGGSALVGHDHEAEHGPVQTEHGEPVPPRPGPHISHLGHGDLHADHAPRRLLRTDLRRGWCEPPEHSHVSTCGTPYVHGFGTEPAFLGRDIFLDGTRAGGETEVETEIEWSLTRRLGLIAEIPYIAADESGFGDVGLGLRALLVEERRFLLSASTEVDVPTGSERRGLGSGSFAIGANLHTWTDLGSWITLQTQVGLGYVPDERESMFAWSATLAKSFRISPLIWTCSSGHDDHGPTVFTLLAEIQGDTALSANTGATEGRWLLGASYPLTRHLDLRGAFSRSFGGDEDVEAWTLGFILHL